MAQSHHSDSPVGVGFFRRMGAWLYDALVLIAVEMLAIGLVVALVGLMTYMGFSIEGYIDVSDYLTRHPNVSLLFSGYVFGIAALFYGYFWTRAGQTIGMKAWKIEIISEFGGRVTATQALIRMTTSCFGLGNLFVFFSPTKRAFQDVFANSQIIKKQD